MTNIVTVQPFNSGLSISAFKSKNSTFINVNNVIDIYQAGDIQKFADFFIPFVTHNFSNDITTIYKITLPDGYFFNVPVNSRRNKNVNYVLVRVSQVRMRFGFVEGIDKLELLASRIEDFIIK